MATNPNNPSGPNLGHVAGVAAQVAQGASVSTALKNVVKDSALDALLGPTALFAGGLIGALKAMKAIVEQSGILERGLKNIANVREIQGKFETLLKSAEQATQRIKELYKFTANSPFNFSDVAEANRTLEALTRGALSGARGMQLVGDSAAATGQSMTDASERIGKLYAALSSGRGIERVLFNLQASGIVTDDLAGKLEQAEASGLGFAAMWKVVEQSLESSRGGMAAEARTVKGLTAQLQTASDLMDMAFSKPFEDAQAKGIERTIAATKALTPVMSQMGQDLAPLFTLFTNLKNEVSLNVLSMQGFSTALVVAWKAATALFLGLSAATLMSFGRSAGVAADMIGSFAGNLKSAVAAATQSSAVVAQTALSLQQAAAAAVAADRGHLGLALSLKLQSLWSRASAAATVLHTAAMTASTTAAGSLNLALYGANFAAGGLAKGATMAWAAISTVTKGLVGQIALVFTNPLVAASVAVVALVSGFTAWASAVAQVNREYIDLILGISETNAKLNEQRRNIKNLDEWRDALRGVSAALAKVNEELESTNLTSEQRTAKQGQRRNLESRIGQFRGDDLGRIGLGKEEFGQMTTDVADSRQSVEAARQRAQSNADDAQRAVLLRSEAIAALGDAATGRKANRDRFGFERSASGRNVAANDALLNGMGDVDERAKSAKARFDAAQAAHAAAIQHNAMRARTGAASGGFGSGGAADTSSLAAGLAAAKADLDAASANKASRDVLVAANAAARLNSGSELIATEQKINDLKKVGNTLTSEQAASMLALQRRQAELVILSQAAGDNERKSADKFNEEAQLLRAVDLAKVELDYVRQIATAKAAGANTAALEGQKQIALLDKQIEQADALGKAGELRAAQLRAQRSDVVAEQAKFRAGAGLDREKNDALISRNPRKAQALEDLAARQQLRGEYAANGLSASRADADFKANLEAQAMAGAPAINVSALQRVGGGTGGPSGNSPAEAAQLRIATMAELHTTYLKIIADSVGGKSKKLGGLAP